MGDQTTEAGAQRGDGDGNGDGARQRGSARECNGASRIWIWIFGLAPYLDKKLDFMAIQVPRVHPHRMCVLPKGEEGPR